MSFALSYDEKRIMESTCYLWLYVDCANFCLSIEGSGSSCIDMNTKELYAKVLKTKNTLSVYKLIFLNSIYIYDKQ